MSRAVRRRGETERGRFSRYNIILKVYYFGKHVDHLVPTALVYFEASVRILNTIQDFPIIGALNKFKIYKVLS